MPKITENKKVFTVLTALLWGRLFDIRHPINTFTAIPPNATPIINFNSCFLLSRETTLIGKIITTVHKDI